VGAGPNPWYPDLVLQAAEKSRKLQGVVEVETAESVNHLEAMSQWATFAKLRVPFHLYVPAASVDSARRLCADLQIPADELVVLPLGGRPAQVRARAAIGGRRSRSPGRRGRRRSCQQRGEKHERKVSVKKAAAAPARRPAAKAAKPAPAPKLALPAKLVKPAKPAPKPATKPAVKAVATVRAKNGNGKTTPAKAVSRLPVRSAKAAKRK
jgi:hypothetical protein